MLVGAGLVLFPFWVGGTALGALAGDVLGDPSRLGFDGALPALFLALLVTQLVDRRAKIAARRRRDDRARPAADHAAPACR